MALYLKPALKGSFTQKGIFHLLPLLDELLSKRSVVFHSVFEKEVVAVGESQMEADDWLWPSLERTDVFVFHQRNNRGKKKSFSTWSKSWSIFEAFDRFTVMSPT